MLFGYDVSMYSVLFFILELLAGNHEWIHRTSRGVWVILGSPNTHQRLRIRRVELRWGSLGEVLFTDPISPDEICCPAGAYRYMVQIPFSVTY